MCSGFLFVAATWRLPPWKVENTEKGGPEYTEITSQRGQPLTEQFSLCDVSNRADFVARCCRVAVGKLARRVKEGGGYIYDMHHTWLYILVPGTWYMIQLVART